MNKKEMLKAKARPTLPTSLPSLTNVVILPKDELRNITLEIKSNLDELKDISEWWKTKKERASELKQIIIEKLIYIQEHRKQLLPERTFDSYLSEDLEIAKGYFYEQVKAYHLCIEYKKPEIFNVVDSRILVDIAKIQDKEKQKELFAKVKEINRDYVKNVRRTNFLDTLENNVIINKKTKTVKFSSLEFLEKIEKILLQEQKCMITYEENI